ncbi:MAG: peptidase S41 [Candidatus Aminicenantes bacterium]|nr:MAG: peptidase S41 [Candidatus Aminicenantes bacterium]
MKKIADFLKGFSSKKTKIIFWIFAVIIFVSFNQSWANKNGEDKVIDKSVKEQEIEDDFYRQVPIFTEAVTLIRNGYVNETKGKDLIYGALRGMLSSLDSHSQFMDPREYKEMNLETKGEFGGVGIVISIKNNLLTVISPIEGTPAFKAGIKAGDIIVKIDGESSKDISLYKAVDKIRGETGSEVTLTIMREGARKLLDFTIVRDIIEVKAVKEAKLLTDNIGYIKLVVFNEKTNKELEEALDKLEEHGADSLILDLRNNPGGLLTASVETSSKFIKRGKLIVYTQGREKKDTMRFSSKGRQKSNSIFFDCPLVVLVNEGSASASEIVAGAIQDYQRGILLGSKTFGKGSVQTVLPLSDGSGLRLTTAKYFTPLGRCIQDKGIIPDIVAEIKEEQKAILRDKPRQKQENEKRETEEEQEQNENEENGEKVYDSQLQRAIDLLQGIKIYQK